MTEYDLPDLGLSSYAGRGRVVLAPNLVLVWGPVLLSDQRCYQFWAEDGAQAFLAILAIVPVEDPLLAEVLKASAYAAKKAFSENARWSE